MRTMKNTHDKATASHKRFAMWAVLIACILGITTNADAYLHPTLGRFVQRDREGYSEGMNLYEPYRSSPAGRVDWMGLASQDSVTTKPGLQPTSRPVDDLPKKLADATDFVKKRAREYMKLTPTRYFESWEVRRGEIHFASALVEKVGGLIKTPGASMVIDFVPDKNAGECCKRIDILQFVHSLKAGKDFFLPPEEENKRRSYEGWQVDRITAKPGKSPYLAHQAKGANTGRTGKDAKPLRYYDDPDLLPHPGPPAKRRHKDFKGKRLGQGLVTCIICVDGPDAKDGIAIYGCVGWGWSWRRAGPEGTTPEHRLIPPKFFKKLPIPRVFGEVIKRWNKDSGPEHRIRYQGEVGLRKDKKANT